MNPETRRHMLRFLIIGTLSVGVDGGSYVLLQKAGLDLRLAKGLSYALGMVLGFLGNKAWTFGSARRSADEPVTYLILYALTLGLNILANSWVLGLGGGKQLAFFAATGLTTVLNFLGMRFITFRKGVEERRLASS